MDYEEIPSLDELKRKLERLSILDPQLQVFGANLHKYESHPLSNAELEHLEGELGVRLPAGYPNFLLEIGYGAGPYYGLYGPERILNEIDEDFSWDEELLPEPYRLPEPSRPFPFGREQAEECWRIMGERRSAIFQTETEGYADGCIPICFEGCTFMSMLVTAGDLVGSVWSCYNDDCISYNLAPLPPGILQTKRLKSTMSWENLWMKPNWEPALSPEPTFLQWYNAWLDRCLSDLQE